MSFITTTLNEKFKFPGENINQSDNGNYGDNRSTEIIHQLFRNFPFLQSAVRKITNKFRNSYTIYSRYTKNIYNLDKIIFMHWNIVKLNARIFGVLIELAEIDDLNI